MRFIQSILIITLISCGFYSCKDKAKRAKLYHENIGMQTARVIDSVLDYGDALRSYKKEVITSVTSAYLCNIRYHCSNVQAMEDFEGDPQLRNASVKLLTYYNTYLDGKVSPYVSGLVADTLDEHQMQVIDSLYMEFFENEKPFWQEYNSAEKAFSEKYDILSVK
jgi:hypothetical protein